MLLERAIGFCRKVNIKSEYSNRDVPHWIVGYWIKPDGVPDSNLLHAQN